MSLELKEEYEDLSNEELIARVKSKVEKNIRKMQGVSYICVFKAIYDMINTEIPYECVKMLSGFGGGVGLSGKNVCGALSGGMAALGLVYGSPKPFEGRYSEILEKNNLGKRMEKWKNLTRKKAIYNQLINRFKKKFGSCRCDKLIEPWNDEPFDRKRTKNCLEIMKGTAEIVMELILEAEEGGLESFEFGNMVWGHNE